MFSRSLVVILVFFSLLANSVVAQTPSPAKTRQDRILVKFKPGTAPEGEIRPHGRVLKRFARLGVEVIQLDGTASVEQVLATYRADTRVVYAEPDYIRSKNIVPNDPKLTDQEDDPWHFNNDGRDLGKAHADISAPGAWDIRHDAPNVVVAVLDTGIRYTHEDLAANMWRNPAEIGGQEGVDDDGNGFVDDIFGANIVSQNGVPMDDEGHGTFIAGLIGAVGDNGKGLAGVCWKVQLMAVKVLGADGGGSDSDIIEGMIYAADHGARIINASLGRSGVPNLAMEDAISYLNQNGVILVAAAGNSSFDLDYDLQVSAYPASSPLPNVVTVTATTRNDLLAIFSNYGWRSADIGAPGVEIPSTSSENDTAYDVASGTSISAPLVTGALALLTAEFPNLTPLERIARLLNSVDPVPALSGRCASGGRLNLKRALEGGSIAPANDRFARAVQLGGDIYFAGTSVVRGASTQPESNEPTSPRANFEPARRSLWWTWYAPYTGRVVVTAARHRNPNVTDRTIVNVYRGSSLSSLVRLGGNTDNGTFDSVEDTFAFDAVYGQIYYFCAETAATTEPLGFFGRYELAPDGYGKFMVLSVDSYGPGTVTPKNLLGETIQRRGKKITLRATPAPGYILYGWADPAILDLEEAIVSREPVYSFTLPSDKGVLGLQAIFVFNPFRDLNGNYNGLLTPDGGEGPGGFATLKLSTSGAFTGSLRIGTATYRFKGTLRSDREFTTTIKQPGRPPLTLTFKLNYERRITGSVTGEGVSYKLLAEAAHFDFFANPAPSLGYYTVLLPPVDITSGQPAGAGYGFLTVSAAGNVRFNGFLGDGKKFSQGATLYRTGHWPFFATPYKSGGSISGLVTFDEDQFDSDLTGELRWYKSPKRGDRVYPDGFQNVKVELTGSRYEIPAAGQRILSLSSGPENALLTVNGAGLTNQQFLLSVDASNNVQASGGLDMVIFPNFGEFAALLPLNGKFSVVHGMVSRKANRGAGYVIIGKESARVSFGPSNFD